MDVNAHRREPRRAPDGSAACCTAESIRQFEQHGGSWCHHEFRAWQGWNPEIAALV